MKVLTLTQPWATLIAAGHKRLETREWRTSYTGPIAIHAAKGWKAEDRELLREEPFRSALIDAGDRGLLLPSGEPPRGAIVAIAYLSGCYRTPDPEDDLRIHTPPLHNPGGVLVLPPPEPERSFGNYGPRRWVWALGKVRAIQPIPMRGSLGLWTWDGTPAPKPILQDSTARVALCVCGKPARIRCARCGRGDCGTHIEDQPSTGPICMPCGARQKLARPTCGDCGCWPTAEAALIHDCNCACHVPAILRLQARNEAAAAIHAALSATPTPFAADGNDPSECDFCAGMGILGGVACIWCGGTGNHVPPIQTRTGTEG